MEIVYFIANKSQNQITGEFLRSVGLGYAFDGSVPVVRAVESGKGPEGSSGCSVSRSTEASGYFPNRQDWQPHATAENVFVGIFTDSPPTPREMVRSSWMNPNCDNSVSVDPKLLVVQSHEFRNASISWPIPVARAWSLVGGRQRIESQLPRKLQYKTGEDGKSDFYLGDPIAQFERLEQIAETIVDAWRNEDLPDNAFKVAAEVLSTAYHIGPQEMAMIGIVDSRVQTVASLLWLVIDEPGFVEMVKKKQAQELESTGSGNAA